jgi:hypothetical protein
MAMETQSGLVILLAAVIEDRPDGSARYDKMTTLRGALPRCALNCEGSVM